MKRFLSALLAACLAVASFNALACTGPDQVKVDSGGMSKPPKTSN